MPIDFHALASNTSIDYVDNSYGVKLTISTPRLTIRSITSDDISFYQSLWADKAIMEKFADGQPKLFSGSTDEKEEKFRAGQPYDYAEWRIGGWLGRLRDGDIWSGLTILNSEEEKIGHIIIGGGELAYFLIPTEWNKGYASEAAAALTRIAVPILMTQYGVTPPQKIAATVREDHKRSQSVLHNAGLTLGDELNIKEFNGQSFERYIAEVSTNFLMNQYEAWKKSVAIIIPMTRLNDMFFKHKTSSAAEEDASQSLFI
ncbi:MAG: GNAT family N-acetyltransferase [Legionella sp.]|nr:GNAT family N-acetyltransferase [Legionella sp.]